MTKPCLPINIHINGEEVSINSPAFLTQAIESWLKTGSSKPETESYVIALNQNFVPRSLYDQTLLKTGDKIELLSPMAGG